MAFELPYEELDAYVQQICLGQKLVETESSSGILRPLLFKYPSTDDKILAEFKYKQALSEAERMELPSIEEVEVLIKARGIFTDADEEKVEKLRSRIEGQKAILAKTTRVPARRDRLKEVINNLEAEVQKILLKRELHFEITRERKASEEKFLFLTQRSVYDPFTKKRIWETTDSFHTESDFRWRRKVFLDYIVFSHGLEQKIIRYIARSNVWRIRYVTAIKTGDSLFGIPIKDYNIDQLMLLYWSHYYQSINEMMPDDRPNDEIIEDDQALDAYMKDWQADRNRDTIASKAKKGKNYGQNSAWDHGETLVMQSNPMHKDIEYSETLGEKAQHSKDSNLDAAPVHRSKKKKR